MADGDYRSPTARELELVRRFIARVQGKRSAVNLALQTGSAAASAQKWFTDNGIAYPSTVFNDDDKAIFEDLARKATLLEKYASALQLGKVFFRPNDAGDDFAILVEKRTSESPDSWQGVGFAGPEGAIPLALILVVAGVVLVTVAISTASAFYQWANAKREEKKKAVAQLDAWATSQGGSTLANWKAFKEENKKENSSFWEDIGGKLGGVLAGVAVAFVFFKFVLPELDRERRAS